MKQQALSSGPSNGCPARNLTAWRGESYTPREDLRENAREMKVYRKSATSKISAAIARGLAFVLLTCVVYSVIFSSVHNHGSVSPNANTSISANATGQASVSSTIPLKNAPNGDGCLICLFHKQLFNSVVHDPVFVTKPSQEVVVAATPTIYCSSNPIASSQIGRLSGRAPPAA